MGRSGTSSLTRVLGLCGAALPRTPLPPVPDNNERGFWEPTPIVRAHDRILDQLGTTWDGPMPPDTPIRDEWVEELAGLVNDQYANAPLIVLKDPRVSRLVPLWMRVADSMRLRLACVIALRHPEEVAMSLARREGYARDKSLRLWREYTLSAERYTRDLPRVVVPYEWLLADWRSQIVRIAKTLDLALDPDADAPGVERFLDARLRHHRVTEDAPLDRATSMVHREMMRLATERTADTEALDRAALELGAESAELRRHTLRRVAPVASMEFTGERYVPSVSGEIETEHVARYVFASTLCADKRVLDIASGEGYGSAMLAQVASEVVGVDIDPASVDHANRNYAREGLSFEVGSCEQIPAKRDSFDVVVSFETIEHIEDHARFLREVRRVLRPGGVFLCSTPDTTVYLAGQPKNPFHKRELTGDEFESLLSKKFEHAAFFGQRLVSGSVIVRDENARTEVVRTADGRAYQRAGAREGATYRIGVCTDGRLPRIPDQILSDARFSIGMVSSLTEIRARLEAEVAAQAKRVAELSARCETAERKHADAEVERARASSARELNAQELARLSEDRGRLLAERQAAQAERNAAIRDLATSQVDYQRTVAELDRVRESLIEAREKAAAAQASLAATTSESETLRRVAKESIEARDAALAAQKQAEIEAARAEERTVAARQQAEAQAARNEECIAAVRHQAETQTARSEERVASAQHQTQQARAHAEQARLAAQCAATETASAHARAAAVAQELAALRASRSWRWTAPLRLAATAGTSVGLKSLSSGARTLDRLRLPGAERLRIVRTAALIRRSPLFDAGQYLRLNPDVAAAGIDPAWHFTARGKPERRPCSDRFDTAWYLDTYPDVAAATIHPLEHYLTQGIREGRRPKAEVAVHTAPAFAPITPAPPPPPPSPPPSAIEVSVPAAEPIPVVAVDPGQIARTKVLAFYLPQFHPIPENDAWWGKGFTEWANVTRARPMFPGHAQPILPGELGFYDLRLPEVRERQAELARAAGIHGFCYHHYWFNGQRVLERPLNEVITTGTPDLPFCVCWANENWTRRWDGHEDEVLLRQRHTLASDRRFILDLIPCLEDPRYVRVDGRPVIVVYRAELMQNPADTAAVWRDECRRAGLGEIHLCSVYLFKFDPRPLGFDASIEFPLHHFPAREITRTLRGLPEGYTGVVRDYPSGVHELIRNPRKVDYRLYRGVMPSWDNTARRMEKGATVYHGATPELYEAWLASAINQRHADEGQPGAIRENLVFVNAWNEWAEGAVLEPRRDFGDAYLRATARVLKGSADALDIRIALNHATVASPLPSPSDADTHESSNGTDDSPIEHRIKRIIRRSPALDTFVNRHPEVKAHGMRLVRGITRRMERDSPSSSAPAARPAGVHWRGRRAPAAGADAARLLVVSHDAYPAGAQLILLENVRHWASDPTLDVRVVLLGPGRLENDLAALCPTVCTEDMRPATPEDALRSVLADLARDDWRADAAFCNSAASAEACEIIARAGVPVVSAVYELPTSIESELGGRRTVERLTRSASAVIVASAFVRDRLAEAYALDAASLTALHTGVLQRAWPDRDTARAGIRAELGVPPETVIVLGCGSIHHRKGTDLFVAAAARARAAGLRGPIVFAWVGQDQRGATFRTWCEHDADRLGVRDIVRLVGPRDDPAPWFAGSDIFAMTSREDPFPMVNLEALANGLGVVAFDNAGGAGEVLRPDRGVVVPYLDVDAMGAAIARLAGDPAELEALRGRADAFARDHLGWDRYMRDLRAVLAGVAPAFGQKAGVRA